MLTEFGSDAYNIQANKEDQEYRQMPREQLKDIFIPMLQAWVKWKLHRRVYFPVQRWLVETGQTSNLDEHDATASWSNGGYPNDFQARRNNMNEEWFGISAKGKQMKEVFMEL